MAIQYMRRSIQKKAKFDIMDLNCAQVSQFITLLSWRFVSLELTAHMCFSKNFMLNSSIWDFICLWPFLQCQWCSLIFLYVIWWNRWFFFFFFIFFCDLSALHADIPSIISICCCISRLHPGLSFLLYLDMLLRICSFSHITVTTSSIYIR